MNISEVLKVIERDCEIDSIEQQIIIRGQIEKLLDGVVPEKDRARWGSENQDAYVQYEHGFNACRAQVAKRVEDAKK